MLSARAAAVPGGRKLGHDRRVRVLLVEDDPTIAEFVERGLREAGFAVERAPPTDARGSTRRLAEPYDAAIVDVMLPQMDGLALIDALRARGVRMPVLILSAKRTVDDRVRGLQAGGDDYLTKPFDFAELLARVQALIRRATGAAEPTRLTVGDLTLDLLTRKVQRGAQLDRAAAARVRAARVPACATPGASSRRRRSCRTSGATTSIPTPTSSTCWCRGCAIGSTSPSPTKLLHTVRGVGYVLRPTSMSTLRRALGLRLSVWYAAVFTISTIGLVALTYALLASSLVQRDHDIIRATLREYASRYELGGLPALRRAVELEERTGGQERLFVRVLGPLGDDAVFVRDPQAWSAYDVEELDGGADALGEDLGHDRRAVLEVASAQLLDGTVLQVGKTNEIRLALLRRFELIVGAGARASR